MDRWIGGSVDRWLRVDRRRKIGYQVVGKVARRRLTTSGSVARASGIHPPGETKKQLETAGPARKEFSPSGSCTMAQLGLQAS